MADYDEINGFEEDDEDNIDDNLERYLVFVIGQGKYGFSIGIVKEIITMQAITEIPDMPSYVKGVINLRGKIIPAMDLRIRFKMPEVEYKDTTCIIVIRSNAFLIGLIVDQVHEVMRIPKDNVETVPEYSKEYHHQFIRGLGKKGEDIYILLDENKILFSEDVEQLTKLFNDNEAKKQERSQ